MKLKYDGTSDSAGDDGVALVLALLFIVLLTAMVVDFSYEMEVEASLSASHDTDFEAYLAAKSAIASGMALLAVDLLQGEEAAALNNANPYDSLDELWAEGIPLTPINESVMQCLIEDEFGKLNLNALVRNDDQGQEGVDSILEEALRLFFEARGVEEDPVDSIIDWLDSDDEALPRGAENDYYSSLEVPYTCKNGPMDSLEELLLIPGITPEVYFGIREEQQLPLDAYFTVQGHPEGKVNANTAQIEVLASLFAALGEPDPLTTAEDIVISREEEGPFSNEDEFERFGLVRPGPQPARSRNRAGSRTATGTSTVAGSPNALDFLDWSSSVFRLYGDGQNGETQVRIVADVWRDTDGSGSDQLFRVINWRIVR